MRVLAARAFSAGSEIDLTRPLGRAVVMAGGLVGSGLVGLAAVEVPEITYLLLASLLVLASAVFLSRFITSVYCFFVLVVLGGYMTLNRGFSGLHLPLGGLPLFVGELALASLLFFAVPRLRHQTLPAPIYYIGAWMAFGFLLTVGHLPTYGLDAVRDAAIWYYGAFTLVGIAVWRSDSQQTLRRWLTRVFLFSLVAAPLGVLGEQLPRIELPITDGALLIAKHDSIGMHLLGVAVFFLTGRYLTGASRLQWVAPVVAAVGVGYVLFSQQRATFVGLAGVMVLMLFYRRFKPVLMTFAITLTVLGLLLLLDFEVETSRGTFSVKRALERQLSTFDFIGGEGESLESSDSGTIYWRLVWWDALFEEARQDPRILFIGRGFGPDLRDVVAGLGAREHSYEDGLESGGRPVRSPHNYLMTLLARTGVIGLMIWLAMIGSVFGFILRATLACRRAGDQDSELNGVWAMAHLLLIILVASLGVILESPHGAIPFFLILGIGLGWAADVLAPHSLVERDAVTADGIIGRRSIARPLAQPSR